MSERAQQRGWAPLAQHKKKCLPEEILVSSAMQPYLRRWATADDEAAVEEAAVAAATELVVGGVVVRRFLSLIKNHPQVARGRVAWT